MRIAHLALTFLVAAGCSGSPTDDSLAFTDPADDEKADRPGASLSPTGPFAVTGAYPIVLHHGFNASPDSDWGWHPRVKQVLESLGHQVFISQVNPYATPEARAAELRDFVLDVLTQTGAPQVHIIAHSQGGLDARLLVHPAGYNLAVLVRSITTISTPHRGTFVADTAGPFLDTLAPPDGSTPAELPKLSPALDWLTGILAKQLNAKASTYVFDLRGALHSMAEKTIDAEFNDRIFDLPGFYYQSYAGVSNVGSLVNPADVAACEIDATEEGAAGTLSRLRNGTRDTMTGALVPVAGIVAHGLRLLPNDGVVRVDSARWGRFRGCLLTDHMGEVGQGNHAGAKDPRTGFDIYVFYAGVAAELVREHQ